MIVQGFSVYSWMIISSDTGMQIWGAGESIHMKKYEITVLTSPKNKRCCSMHNFNLNALIPLLANIPPSEKKLSSCRFTFHLASNASLFVTTFCLR